DRADQKAADADVRSALPAVEAYYSDCGIYANETAADECHDGATLNTFDLAGIRKYDAGAKFSALASVGTDQTYCIGIKVGGKTAYAVRGAAPFGTGDIQESVPTVAVG